MWCHTIDYRHTRDEENNDWKRLAGRLTELNLSFKLMLASILVLLVFPHVDSAFAIDEISTKEARDKLAEAFEAVAEAEGAGGDVSGLVEQLSEAAILLERAGVEGDEGLLRDLLLKVEGVIAEAPVVAQHGAAEEQARMVWSWFVVGLVAVLAVIVWRYEPRVFWRLWVRSKRGWKVKS